MSAELDALHAAEAALKAAEEKLEAVEHPVVEAASPTQLYSQYLGHIGEPCVVGKDF